MTIQRLGLHRLEERPAVGAPGQVRLGDHGQRRRCSQPGRELELRAMLTDHLALSLSGAVTDAKITKASAGAGATDGSHLLGVPENTASIGLDYNRPLTDRVDGFVSVNWSHTGESYGTYATTSKDYRRPSCRLGRRQPGHRHRQGRGPAVRREPAERGQDHPETLGVVHHPGVAAAATHGGRERPGQVLGKTGRTLCEERSFS
ncbi:hypothetical protein ACRAWD_18355 [Caulobacter segnis]